MEFELYSSSIPEGWTWSDSDTEAYWDTSEQSDYGLKTLLCDRPRMSGWVRYHWRYPHRNTISYFETSAIDVRFVAFTLHRKRKDLVLSHFRTDDQTVWTPYSYMKRFRILHRDIPRIYPVIMPEGTSYTTEDLKSPDGRPISIWSPEEKKKAQVEIWKRGFVDELYPGYVEELMNGTFD